MKQFETITINKKFFFFLRNYYHSFGVKKIYVKKMLLSIIYYFSQLLYNFMLFLKYLNVIQQTDNLLHII